MDNLPSIIPLEPTDNNPLTIPDPLVETDDAVLVGPWVEMELARRTVDVTERELPKTAPGVSDIVFPFAIIPELTLNTSPKYTLPRAEQEDDAIATGPTADRTDPTTVEFMTEQLAPTTSRVDVDNSSPT